MALKGAGIVTRLLSALPVGLFATTFVRGRGYGALADIGIGLIGALLGVFAVGPLRIRPRPSV